ncbi:hypothetical protein Aph01nite_55110 [Acrocarpospora phusangensis]|uniref:Uncharacterized protein n=1 Tax=Acrocarpospora phusangensis TaxID=1070424 RepID=A0A919QG04_9ACTN|nr:hypothetical protein [Acrocarpospora phusangensis]GIH27201.1 hypothetical protein Aph01nite_55110 [Acrocarpospora phusangensis]
MHSGVSDGQVALNALLEALKNARSGALTTRQQRLAHLATMREQLTAAVQAYASSHDAEGAEVFVRSLVAWINACPVTSAALASATLDQNDVQQLAPAWEAAFEEYLGVLVQQLGTAGPLTPAVRPWRTWILAGIRRSAVTIGVDAGNRIRVCALTDPRLVRCRRQAVYLLLEKGNGAPLVIHKVPLPAYQLGDEDLTGALKERNVAVDLAFVPAAESRAVVRAVFAADSTGAIAQAGPGFVWPLTIPVPGGFVRYELVVGAGQPGKKVRPERLGEVADWPLPAYLTGVPGLQGRKDALQRTFRLAALDDRRATQWTAGELGRVAAAFARMPAHATDALRGAALVRDGDATAARNGVTHGGYTHNGYDALDNGDQLSPPPHAHYYNVAFDPHDRRSCGPPGDAGSGGDFTLLHELGHVVSFCPRTTLLADRNALVRSCEPKLDDLLARAKRLVAVDDRPAVVTWTKLLDQHVSASSHQWDAAETLCDALHACDAQRIAQAVTVYRGKQQAAATASDQLRDAAVNLDLVLPATDRDAVRITGEQLSQNAIPDTMIGMTRRLYDFVRYAAAVEFTPFTDYGHSSNEEFFAETLALFGSDRERLFELNWRVCRWLEDGYPGPTGYNPDPLG